VQTVIHPLVIRHGVEALLDPCGLEFKAPTPKRTPLDFIGAMYETIG
jgi:hypothetical protein